MAGLILVAVAGLLITAPPHVEAGVQPLLSASSVASVTGRVRFGESLQPAQHDRLVIHAALATSESLGAAVEAVVREDGTFVLEDISGPRIIRVAGQGTDGVQWWFESVLWNGRDVTNEPVDFSLEARGELVVVMALRPTAIVGSVEDIAGIPMTDACVVMLPADVDLLRGWSTAVGTTTTDRRGRFYFTGMPPGDYRVEGIGQECPDRVALLGDADALMRRATAVTVGAGKVARIVVTGETMSARW
jgi:hypothetical protein